jgi:hypothetical protein
MGGGFGGREHYDVERDAARLAAAVGRPVKVQWSREDEFRAARHRPASSHRVRLRADAQGRLSDWWHAFVSGHVIFARERLPGWLLGPVRLMGDLGVARCSEPPYATLRRRVEYADVDLPVDLGTWRSLGGSPNTFAIESALDELARLRASTGGVRLGTSAGTRLAECLRTASSPSGCRCRQGAAVGRGYACGIYEERSFVAAGAGVRRSGEWRDRVLGCAARRTSSPSTPTSRGADRQPDLGPRAGAPRARGDQHDEVASRNFDATHPADDRCAARRDRDPRPARRASGRRRRDGADRRRASDRERTARRHRAPRNKAPDPVRGNRRLTRPYL